MGEEEDTTNNNEDANDRNVLIEHQAWHIYNALVVELWKDPNILRVTDKDLNGLASGARAAAKVFQVTSLE